MTTYRLIAALGALGLLAAGLANPSDATLVADARYLTVVFQVTFLALTFVSATFRRHAGWGAYLVNTMVVLYLCSMLYSSNLSFDSLVASFVGVLICGMVLHRVLLVVAFLGTAAAIHIMTAYAVADPVIDPMTVTVNSLLYIVFVGVMLGLQISARERRRNSESIMGAIFDQSSDALVYGDLAASKVFRANRRAEQLFESQDLAFIGRQVRAGFLADHSGDDLPAIVERALADPSWGIECQFESASGQTFWGNLALRRLDAPYQNLMLARVTDMTQQREREAALESARAAAEQAAHTRSQFLANMSHEIRTPMNGVIGMTSLLLKTPLDEDQQRYVDIVRSSGESLLTIINEILDFSKIEANQVRLERVRFDVEEVVLEAMQMVGPQAQAKGIEMVLQMLPGQHRFFLGDALRVRQVLVNLISNAVKFTAAGDVTVAVDVVPGDGESEEVHFRVMDTGIGIPADQAGLLFEPFVQADASTTRQYGGTGLGLSISKSLVELMGGRVALTSEPGVGSTFSFYVVLDRAPARRSVEGQGLEGRRVALIQAHARSGEALAAMLRAVGMSVTGFGRPDRLLDEYQSGIWDVIVADLYSPTLSGVELVAALQSIDDARPPVVLVAPLQSRETCDADIATIVRKPVRASELLRALQDLLGVVREADAAEVRSPESRPSFHEISVLVAEDNPVNQQVVRQMLRNLGARMVVVDDGQAAVEAAAEGAFDMVLMDVQMPRMDGLQATREIRARLGERPFIAAMTASAMAADRAACMAAGMDDFMAKPVRIEDLERRLRMVVARREGNGAAGG
ncbi:MAG: response regulator [Pseudomonadales bacterium]